MTTIETLLMTLCHTHSRRVSGLFVRFCMLAILAHVMAGAAVAKDPLAELQRGIKRFELSNGIRVLLYKRDVAPVFQGQVWVRVGGVNEKPHNSGIAHMLEHMAFKGTPVVGTKDYDEEQELLEELEKVMAQKLKAYCCPTSWSRIRQYPRPG